MISSYDNHSLSSDGMCRMVTWISQPLTTHQAWIIFSFYTYVMHLIKKYEMSSLDFFILKLKINHEKNKLSWNHFLQRVIYVLYTKQSRIIVLMSLRLFKLSCLFIYAHIYIKYYSYLFIEVKITHIFHVY